MNRTRLDQNRFQRTISFVTCAIFVIYSVLVFQPITPDGVACPVLSGSAVATKAAEPCCPATKNGALTTYTKSKTVVQCRCAERQRAKSKFSQSEKLVLFFSPGTLPDVRVIKLYPSRCFPRMVALISHSQDPSFRPPDSV